MYVLNIHFENTDFFYMGVELNDFIHIYNVYYVLVKFYCISETCFTAIPSLLFYDKLKYLKRKIILLKIFHLHKNTVYFGIQHNISKIIDFKSVYSRH